MKGCGSSPSIASPVTGRFLSSSARTFGPTGFAQHHARIADRVGHNPVVARQRPQLARVASSRLRNVSAAILGIEPVGLREHGVERDHDRAKPGQVGDDVGDPRPRPRPLAEPRIGQALFVDIDDGDRPHGFHAGFDRWKVSKVLTRSSSIGAGSRPATRQSRSAAQGTSAGRSRTRRLNHLRHTVSRLMLPGYHVGGDCSNRLGHQAADFASYLTPFGLPAQG